MILSCCFTAPAFAHKPAEFLQKIQGTKNEGAEIVGHFCAMCHAEQPQISIGAPRMGHFKDWESRLSHGIKPVFKHAMEGLRAMPPRGGCFECSDEQLMLAIESIIGKDGQNYVKSIKKNL